MNAWAPVISEILQEGPWFQDQDEHPSDRPDAEVARAFRASMRRLAAGTCAVTVCDGERIDGLTATSVTSLSMEPPSLLVSVRATSRVMNLLRREKRFTVHILGDDQSHEANAFAGRLGSDARASLVGWDHGPGERQRLSGATCHIDCKAARFIPVFSHMLIVGVVISVDIGENDRPLVYFGGAFHSLTRSDMGQ
ncbi:MAG: flavin reductase [Rhizobiaceae bacterium]|nr:flavin reductase [Rhizobiaceae bacterium]